MYHGLLLPLNSFLCTGNCSSSVKNSGQCRLLFDYRRVVGSSSVSQVYFTNHYQSNELRRAQLWAPPAEASRWQHRHWLKWWNAGYISHYLQFSNQDVVFVLSGVPVNSRAFIVEGWRFPDRLGTRHRAVAWKRLLGAVSWFVSPTTHCLSCNSQPHMNDAVCLLYINVISVYSETHSVLRLRQMNTLCCGSPAK